MPRYFINIRNSSAFVRDEEGRDLPGIEQAQEAAIDGARSLLSAEVTEGKLDLRGSIEIEDERGEVIMVVPFRDALDILEDE